jgi:hypothetical protein
MAGRRCRVSYCDTSGIRHTVTVQADGVHEAGCLALAEFKAARREGAWGDPPGTATELTIEVLPPPTVHAVRVGDLLRWLEGGATDPAKGVQKSRLRKLLA